jgi:tetraacyldisaccharide 4'-kinase
MRRLPAWWQRRGLGSLLLMPLTGIYWLLATVDRLRHTPRCAPLPVLVLGNLTAGGAGKTPATMAMVSLLEALGQHPHILSRGYGGVAQTAHRVTPSDTAREVGDEALLLARIAPTWVGRHRYASAHAAKAAGATLVVCDDGLQHHALAKDVAVLVVDGAYGLGNGMLLPSGPLREPLRVAHRRCQATILIGEDVHSLAQHLPQPVFRAQLVPTPDPALVAYSRWVAFAGIARPEKFYVSLQSMGVTPLATIDFPDHHAYSAADIARVEALAAHHQARLITTEKDAVKLPPETRKGVAVLRVSLQFEDTEAVKDWLLHHLPAPFMP